MKVKSQLKEDETPTPRTDAAAFELSVRFIPTSDERQRVVPIATAKELERECAELRQTCSDLRHQLAARKTKAQQYCDEINALLLERDAALSRERRLREAIEPEVDDLRRISQSLFLVHGGEMLSAKLSGLAGRFEAALAFDGKEGA